ncbi:MAG: arylamine N-acetyltransferase [Ginsengibacter sp.]
MNIPQYLQRIDYAGPLDPTFEVLSQLQLAQLLTVPFENLDIYEKIKINLDDLFDKVVTRRRGGFCYELNGLFYELLKEIGFTVKMISARVYTHKKDYSPEFDHMAIIALIQEVSYLVDVGFGEFAFSPVNIKLNSVTSDPRGLFRIDPYDETHKIVSKKKAEGAFVPEYMFSEKERHINEFYDRCLFHQTSLDSHFTQNRICSLPTKNGRITLAGNIVKITENGTVTERHLHTEEEVRQELWNYFGIQL